MSFKPLLCNLCWEELQVVSHYVESHPAQSLYTASALAQHITDSVSCARALMPRQEPFIVTSCGHCFCMKHEHDQKIKESTCPGCGSHLARANGLKVAHFSVAPESTNTLNGLAPESVLQLAGSAIQFWCARACFA